MLTRVTTTPKAQNTGYLRDLVQQIFPCSSLFHIPKAFPTALTLPALEQGPQARPQRRPVQ